VPEIAPVLLLMLKSPGKSVSLQLSSDCTSLPGIVAVLDAVGVSPSENGTAT
jgi:hypothetical protein